ncbi:hypothetical protein Tsubulata_018254 [Turnera subulata]|uniref:Benzyl alcohol O-benzoyltransferase n=1 Tax=Turnera subulata TaxID=218843 RepID=A0A9Q0J9L6_9ROSI|nr:hypothetical protein Tsubulata_018254 [Turnera subulata]
MAMAPVSHEFEVHRREPELLRPAEPTPHEFKYLSDIDDQEGFRFHLRGTLFFRNNPSMVGKDPVKNIREAIAKTLVFYYPFAGRLRDGPNRKLIMECNGEGIVFIEADAEATIEDFGDPIKPPFPCMEELLYDVPGSTDVLNCPVILIQVTRLKCGGFIFALRYNHTVCDGPGIVQFMCAVGEIARGADTPSVLPVWERHLLSASDPPRVTHQHLEYQEIASKFDNTCESEDLVDRSFYFGPKQVSTLKNLLPPGRHSAFEILTACLWRCRTIALQLHPKEEVRFMCVVNARAKFNPPILPQGYYGNGFVLPVVATTAGELCKNPVGYSLDLVKKAKAKLSEDYVRSVASYLVLNGRPHFNAERTFIMSDIKNAGFSYVDFGWGEGLYGGTSEAGSDLLPGCSYITSFTTSDGEKGTVVSLSLPAPVMERFVKELDLLLTSGDAASKFVKSSL